MRRDAVFVLPAEVDALAEAVQDVVAASRIRRQQLGDKARQDYFDQFQSSYFEANVAPFWSGLNRY